MPHSFSWDPAWGGAFALSRWACGQRLEPKTDGRVHIFGTIRGKRRRAEARRQGRSHAPRSRFEKLRGILDAIPRAIGNRPCSVVNGAGRPIANRPQIDNLPHVGPLVLSNFSWDRRLGNIAGRIDAVEYVIEGIGVEGTARLINASVPAMICALVFCPKNVRNSVATVALDLLMRSFEVWAP
jgi:hypothetical protein